MERSTMLLRTVNQVNHLFQWAIYPNRAIGAPVLWDPPESIGEAAPGYQGKPWKTIKDPDLRLVNSHKKRF